VEKVRRHRRHQRRAQRGSEFGKRSTQFIQGQVREEFLEARSDVASGAPGGVGGKETKDGGSWSRRYSGDSMGNDGVRSKEKEKCRSKGAEH